jgi:hypothetical protein
MTLKTLELISLLIAAFVGGMFWGPWLALTRTMNTFEPEVFIAIVRRMSRNMAPLMTAAMPMGMVAMIPLLIVSRASQPLVFATTLAGLILFAVALLVTVVIEVPIVKRIETWTPATLPVSWGSQRDRWRAFHIVRVAAAACGVILLMVGAIYS